MDDSSSELTLLKATAGDLELLRHICVSAYLSNFAEHWEKGAVEGYIEDVFGLANLKKELSNPDIYYFIALNDSIPIAFMKLVVGINAEHLPNLELDKIYVLPEYKGNGAGKLLWQKLLEIAKSQDIKRLSLSVIDSNLPAIHFYEKLGFYETGRSQLNYFGFKEELKGLIKMKMNLG